MGIAYFDKKDYNEAIDNVERAITIDQNLGQNIIPKIKDLKAAINKLQESLSNSFMSR